MNAVKYWRTAWVIDRTLDQRYLYLHPDKYDVNIARVKKSCTSQPNRQARYPLLRDGAPDCCLSVQGEPHANRPSSQQFPLPARAVAIGRARRSLRDRALSASTGHARTGRIARGPSAREIPRHYRQRQHHRGIGRDRGIPHRHPWQRTLDPAAQNAGAAALHLLAALRGGIGDAAAFAKIAVHADAETRAGAVALLGAQGLH